MQSLPLTSIMISIVWPCDRRAGPASNVQRCSGDSWNLERSMTPISGRRKADHN